MCLCVKTLPFFKSKNKVWKLIRSGYIFLCWTIRELILFYDSLKLILSWCKPIQIFKQLEILRTGAIYRVRLRENEPALSLVVHIRTILVWGNEIQYTYYLIQYMCSVISKCSTSEPSLFKMKVKTLKKRIKVARWGFQGQYLRSLSINYVSNKKDGKITTTEDFLKVLYYYYYFFGWLTRGRLVASLQPQLC